MDAFLAKLERELECTLCLERFKLPTTLPCQHTYCRDCIKGHAGTSSDGETFHCPICRALIQIPEGNDFCKFPASFLCKNLVDIVSTSHQQSQVFCEEKFHETELLKYFCKTCYCCICHACSLDGKYHKDHDIVTVDEESNVRKQLLLGQEKQLQEKSKEYQATLRGLEDMEKLLNMSSNNAEQNIDSIAVELHSIIEQNRRDSKLKIRQRKEETSTMLDKEMQEINTLLKAITDIREYTNNVVEGLSSCEMLQIHNSLLDRFTHLLNTERAGTPINPVIRFVPSKIIEMFHKEELGDISYRAFLSGPTKDPLRALSPVDVSIYSNQTENIDRVIRLEKDVKNLKICDGVGGRYDVQFTPKVPGEFIIEALVNGQHIANSPMNIRVQSQEMTMTGEFKISGAKPMQCSFGIAVNSECSRIAIAERLSRSVYISDMDGTLKTEIKGTADKQLKCPQGVAFMRDSTAIVVADQVDGLVRVFDHETGQQLWSQVIPLFARGMIIRNVHVESTGDVIVCYHHRDGKSHIVVYDARGNVKQTLDVDKLTGCRCQLACCITHGDLWIISDTLNHCIHVIDKRDNSKRRTIGRTGKLDGELNSPQGLAVDGDGNLLVCDFWNYTIQKFTLDGGVFVGKIVFGNFPLGSPMALAALHDGRVMVIWTRLLHYRVLCFK